MLTREQVRAALDTDGVTIRHWAEQNGFDEHDVSKVLTGQWKGRYGKAHDIAVALGLKAGRPAADRV